MHTFTLSEEEETQLRELARTTRDAKTAIRIRVIRALSKGYASHEVADLFMLDEGTVRKWRNKYQKRRSATDWLTTACRGYSGKLTTFQEQTIAAYVTDELITDSKQVVSFIYAQYGIEYTADGVTKLLHRLGFVYKQTTLVPGKLDEEAQAAWLKGYKKLKAKLPDDEIILFGDGVHPSHNVHATKAWVKKGEQKRIPTCCPTLGVRMTASLPVGILAT